MKIVRKIKAWWSGVKFRHHMRERDKARATALYFLRAGHKDLCNMMLREAISCEERAKAEHPLRWAESQPNVRETFAKLRAADFSAAAALKAFERLGR